MADAIITRADARAQGLRRYFTGIPCKHGHISERNTSSTLCLACGRDQVYAYRDRHEDRVIESRLRKRENRLKKQKIWRANNKAKIRRYLDSTVSRRNETSRKWAKKNPEKVCANRNNRRFRELGGGSSLAEEIAEILSDQGNRCAYCRADLRRVKKHLDHIIPLARGGANTRKNLQFLCAACNWSKSSFDPLDYARSIGRLL